MSENETKTETSVTSVATTAKSSSWFTRIWSAIVGAAVGVASMFGITSNEVSTAKAKVESINSQVTVAYDALKKGDVTTAAATLQVAMNTGKEVVKDAKALAEKVKSTENVVDTAKEKVTKALVQDQVKKVETAANTDKKTETKVETKETAKTETKEVKPATK